MATPWEVALPFILVFYLANIVLFWWRSDKEPIRSREWTLQMCSAVTGFILTLVTVIGEFNDPDVPSPCHLHLFPAMTFMPGVCFVRDNGECS